MQVEITDFSIDDWRGTGSTAYLQIYNEGQWTDVDNDEHLDGDYHEIPLTVDTTAHRIPEQSVTLTSTTDAIVNANVRVRLVVVDANRKNPRELTVTSIPHTLGPTITWGTFALRANAQLPWRDVETYTKTEIEYLIDQQIGAVILPDASQTVKGMTKLSVAPASAVNPIAVGDNDPRLNFLGAYARASLPSAAAGSFARVTDDLRGLWWHTGTGWVSLTGYANVKDFGASGSETTTTTSGSTPAGASVTVVSATGWAIGHGIYIAGAGVAGAIYTGTVTNIVGSVLTITPATSTVVAGGTLVQHDDTAAINLAIAAVTNRGGGEVFLPLGYYRCNAARDATTNSILTYPQYNLLASLKRTVRLRGEAHSFYEYVGQTLTTHGVTIDASQAAAGSGTQPSVIAVRPFTVTTTTTDFSAIHPEIDGIDFRVSTNPTLTGVNFHNASTCSIRNCTVWTGEAGIVATTEPTNVDTVGIYLPGAFNDNLIVIHEGVFVRGFYTGISYSDHARAAAQATIFYCKQALRQDAMALSTIVSRLDVDILFCPVKLAIAGQGTFDHFMDIETQGSGAGWYGETGNSVTDNSNLGIGVVRYSLQTQTGFVVLKKLGGISINLIDVALEARQGVTTTTATGVPQALTSGTAATLSWSVPSPDGEGYFSAGTPTRITFPSDGTRTLDVHVQFLTNATGFREVYLRYNGTTILVPDGVMNMASHSADDIFLHLPTTRYWAAGDYVEVFAKQTSGGSLNIERARLVITKR